MFLSPFAVAQRNRVTSSLKTPWRLSSFSSSSRILIVVMLFELSVEHVIGITTYLRKTSLSLRRFAHILIPPAWPLWWRERYCVVMIFLKIIGKAIKACPSVILSMSHFSVNTRKSRIDTGSLLSISRSVNVSSRFLMMLINLVVDELFRVLISC